MILVGGGGGVISPDPLAEAVAGVSFAAPLLFKFAVLLFAPFCCANFFENDHPGGNPDVHGQRFK